MKVSYTLCLGGLSFFLFILLTVTGIFLMFFYRPTDVAAWNDISNLQTSVAFGLLVRNMIRDLGAKRKPAGFITVGALAVFLVLCYLLHTRDRRVLANRSAPALPATTAPAQTSSDQAT